MCHFQAWLIKISHTYSPVCRWEVNARGDLGNQMGMTADSPSVWVPEQHWAFESFPPPLEAKWTNAEQTTNFYCVNSLRFRS